MSITPLNKQILEEEILQSNATSLVKVITNSCPNCNVVKPIYEASSKENAEAKYYELNANENLALAKSLKIFGVPTTLFYRHGVLTHKKTGVISEEKISKILSEIDQYSKDEATNHKYRSLIDKVLRRK